VRNKDRGGDLYVRSQRALWKDGVRMLPADASDPTFFMLATDEVEPTYLALVRNGAARSPASARAVDLIRAPGPDA
jgi:hypothetical protein